MNRLTHTLAPGGNVEGAVRGAGQAASHRAGHPFIQVRSSRFVRSVIGGRLTSTAPQLVMCTPQRTDQRPE